MSRGRDFRGPGKRSFGDDNGGYMDRGPGPSPYESRPPMGRAPMPAASGPEQDAVVKWFNPEKGFGFAELSDGTGDAFLHIRAVEASGHSELEPGTKLSVRVAPGQRGPQVTEVLSVDTSTAQPRAPRRTGGFGGPGGGGDRFGGGGGGGDRFGGGGGGGAGYGSGAPRRSSYPSAPRETGPVEDLTGVV